MGSNVSSAEGRLRAAQINLESAKKMKKQAKENGSYANANKETKTRVADGRLLNNYDYNIYIYQQAIKKCKAELAEAKKRDAEEKRKAAKKK